MYGDPIIRRRLGRPFGVPGGSPDPNITNLFLS